MCLLPYFQSTYLLSIVQMVVGVEVVVVVVLGVVVFVVVAVVVLIVAVLAVVINFSGGETISFRMVSAMVCCT